MTEEVTYANLKFENSHELGNIAEPEDTKEKGPPASPRSCWPAVLILFTLCLVLLVALVTLTVLFFQIHKDYVTQFQDLNMTKNELHANFSNMLQTFGNWLCLEGEEDFKNNGKNCVLCPANWKWEGGDTCYYHSKEKKSQQQSDQFCSSQNSTLLMIKDRAKLELVKKITPRRTPWLGLTFKHEQRGWYWADNTALTEEQKSWTHTGSQYSCAYFHYTDAYGTSCSSEQHYICEKLAIQLQQVDNHWQDWFVRPK
ncbi:PREDICTED: C-type lectin domain family 12 member B-like [Merops nubicus]|uniref:C-type lectin domain family 12 member B-like n=1 Tax=Merops nubicus TaxID=57421 RepID=UPI0004F033BB|nr:PREDICTED: C-type lectin domain family 12 member B-like [Merops nubicus]